MPNILPKCISEDEAGPLVVALAYDGLCTFEFSIAAEIFGLPRPELGAGWYRFAAAGVESGPLWAHGGLRFQVDGGLELLDAASLIIVPGWKGPEKRVPDNVINAIITAHERGATLASICSGAFVLAATGLLDGKRATTHWRYADDLAAAYPRIEVDASALYVQEDRIFTSAGSAAGIDLMLHIIRAERGAEASNSVARRLVVQPHRNGGQAQFIERPVPAQSGNRLSPLFDKVRAKPDRNWSVRELAREAAVSERTLVRKFLEATGLPPGQWVLGVKVTEAKRLLETTRLTVEEVARLSGFGSTATLRHHFAKEVGVSPKDYRARFNGITG